MTTVNPKTTVTLTEFRFKKALFACSYRLFFFFLRNYLLPHNVTNFSFLLLCIKLAYRVSPVKTAHSSAQAVATGEKCFFLQYFRVSHCPFLITKTQFPSPLHNWCLVLFVCCLSSSLCPLFKYEHMSLHAALQIATAAVNIEQV